MLGYSSIAHAGYVMLGLVTLQTAATRWRCLHLRLPGMSLAAFLVICQVSKDGENVLIEDLSGLHKRNPLAAFLMGQHVRPGGHPAVRGVHRQVPAPERGAAGRIVLLVVLAAVNTAIGIYYYLTVVRVMYLQSRAAAGFPAGPRRGVNRRGAGCIGRPARRPAGAPPGRSHGCDGENAQLEFRI